MSVPPSPVSEHHSRRMGRGQELLRALRSRSGPRSTQGLRSDVVRPFLESDPRLLQALEDAVQQRDTWPAEWSRVIEQDELQAVLQLQEGFLNFYARDAVNPYIPLAARGPWLITAHGAVLYDCGGYGMLGLGHAPPRLLETLAQPWVMANVMTASVAQARLIQALRQEIGHRQGACAYDRFVCLNSGSESITMASRISDIHALAITRPQGPRPGAKIKFLALQHSFHGRTDRPAQASHSSADHYRTHLASFQNLDNMIAVPANDVSALTSAFQQAEANSIFIECLLMEPVMGEGCPGYAISREFYDAARSLTRAHGSLLLIDSIQAGLRAHGCLSIIDYPGFEGCDPPDMEAWSKAIAGGQFPVSILGMTQTVAEIYQRGLYGNTMTANPRACETVVAVLEQLSPELRENIRENGAALLAGLTQLQQEFSELIRKVTGTGLLLSTELAERFPVVGPQGVEYQCRRRGLGVIHGGRNALRFTPPLNIRPQEVTLILTELRHLFGKLTH